MTYHNPVLLKECIEGLKINPNGIYVDVTFGGDGQTQEILKNLDKGRLYAFDRDCDAQKNVLSDEKFKLIHANYKNIKRFMRFEGVGKEKPLSATSN
jgi:16S rRNA (cytosine1402-N4)-methyltransferase